MEQSFDQLDKPTSVDPQFEKAEKVLNNIGVKIFFKLFFDAIGLLFFSIIVDCQFYYFIPINLFDKLFLWIFNKHEYVTYPSRFLYGILLMIIFAFVYLVFLSLYMLIKQQQNIFQIWVGFIRNYYLRIADIKFKLN